MIGLSQLLLAPMLRPRIVHSLRGRVRIQLGALKHLPDDGAHWSQLAESLLAALPGITSAHVGLKTGSVLLTYEPQKVNEDEIVSYVHDLARGLSRHANTLAALPRADLEARSREWVLDIESAGGHRPAFLDRWEVPAHDMA